MHDDNDARYAKELNDKVPEEQLCELHCFYQVTEAMYDGSIDDKLTHLTEDHDCVEAAEFNLAFVKLLLYFQSREKTIFEDNGVSVARRFRDVAGPEDVEKLTATIKSMHAAEVPHVVH